MEVKEKFIMIEQLDEHIDVCIERVQKIMKNDSFVYMELARFNQVFIDKIQEADNKDDLISIWNEMQEKAFISYQFDKDIFNKSLDAFKTTSFDDAKICKNKNQLFIILKLRIKLLI